MPGLAGSRCRKELEIQPFSGYTLPSAVLHLCMLKFAEVNPTDRLSEGSPFPIRGIYSQYLLIFIRRPPLPNPLTPVCGISVIQSGARWLLGRFLVFSAKTCLHPAPRRGPGVSPPSLVGVPGLWLGRGNSGKSLRSRVCRLCWLASPRSRNSTFYWQVQLFLAQLVDFFYFGKLDTFQSAKVCRTSFCLVFLGN